MKIPFSKDNKIKKTVLVISDLHLSAGETIQGKRNPLEDFHFDDELVSFLKYFSSNKNLNRHVELVINGDFLDLLAVPYVEYFDDEFWSEKAANEKLDMIIKAHPEVMTALDDFLHTKNKKLTYIIGNHDAEMIFSSLQERFIQAFSEEVRSTIEFLHGHEHYEPIKGVCIQHGHEYEHAHIFDLENNIVKTYKGDYFIPPLGSYYVTHIVNKYKQERSYINAVRPIKNFMKFGLFFDSFFTIRFLAANIYYVLMVRLWHLFHLNLGLKRIIQDTLKELTLFQDYETLTRSFFENNPQAEVLIVGHTHNPTLREYEDGSIFINTGTWTRMIDLDLSGRFNSDSLPFALIEEVEVNKESSKLHTDLCLWRPLAERPYISF